MAEIDENERQLKVALGVGMALGAVGTLVTLGRVIRAMSQASTQSEATK